jgi:hypothetical protein
MNEFDKSFYVANECLRCSDSQRPKICGGRGLLQTASEPQKNKSAVGQRISMQCQEINVHAGSAEVEEVSSRPSAA